MSPVEHVSKQIKVKHDGNGVPNGSDERIDSFSKSTTEDPIGLPEMKCYTGPKNPDESSAEILALLMTLSRNGTDVVENVDSLTDEIIGNQKDLEKLKEEMCSKMEEGFKKEQQAGQQIHKEIMHGFMNEENARQLVQRNWRSGTFAGPPPLTSRWNEFFFPRKMEFSWMTQRVTFWESQMMK